MSITIQGVEKSYNGNQIFKLAPFELSEGFTCLFGPSGSGKTTIGRIIAGIEKADKGNISGISGLPTVLFQESRLLPTLSAIQNIKAVIPTISNNEAVELLMSVGLTEEDMNKLPSELSGGMIRRVSICRALAFAKMKGGNFVLLDEPFSGIDNDTKKLVSNAIKLGFKEKTVLIITHDEEDTELLNADRLDFLSLFQ